MWARRTASRSVRCCGGARPPSGIDAATVARARAAISDNVRPAKADGRVWSLTGGVAFCACGRRLVATLPGVTGLESPVLRQIYAPDDE
jgi:hypothetical protein